MEDTKYFFSNLGLNLIELEKGKNYPQSLQASSVVDILRLNLEERNIPVYTSFKVKEIIKSKEIFKLYTGDKENDTLSCGKLILACGGKSAPKTGSDGSGYALSKALGHSIVETIPAIVQLKLDHKSLKALSGIKFDGFTEITSNGKTLRKEFGEILFTDYGISGPPILQISRMASKELSTGKDVKIIVDMMPNKTKEDVENFFEIHFGMFSYRKVIDSFIGIINKKLIPILLKEAGVNDIHKLCNELTWQEKKNIYTLLKCLGIQMYRNKRF